VDSQDTRLTVTNERDDLKFFLSTSDGNTTLFRPTRQQLAELIGELVQMLAVPEGK
jgi:hypothetical protein